MFMGLFLNQSFSQELVRGLPIKVQRTSNFLTPLPLHIFSVSEDKTELIHRICPQLEEIDSLYKLNQQELENKCDIKTTLPVNSFLSILSRSKHKEFVSHLKTEFTPEKNKENIETLSRQSLGHVKEFWNFLTQKHHKEEYEKSQLVDRFSSDEPELFNFLVDLSWSFSLERTGDFAPTGIIRKIRDENTSRAPTLLSESKKHLSQWALITLNSYKANPDYQVGGPGFDYLTCEVVFGPDWRVPSFHTIKEEFKELSQTKLFRFLEGKNIWLSDSRTTESGEQEFLTYSINKKSFLYTNHKKRTSFLSSEDYAYRVCVCSTEKNNRSCAFR